MQMNVRTVSYQKSKEDKNDKEKGVAREWGQRKTLKEMQQREYPFLDSDVPGIFNDLLKKTH